VKQLRREDHTRRFSIAMTTSGWEVCEERDNLVVRRAQYRDWHRVERAHRTMAIEYDELRQEGWLDVAVKSEN